MRMSKDTFFKTFTNAIFSRIKDFRGNWNQNDPTADDYIKNRPFYTGNIEYVDIIPLTTIDMSSSVNTLIAIETPSYYETILAITNPFLFEVGNTYTVTWDGVEYNCKAHVDDYGEICVGDFSIYDGNTEPTMPFYISMFDFVNSDSKRLGSVSYEQGACIAALDDGTHTLKVTGRARKIVKIPSEYLPEMNYVSYDDYQSLTGEQRATARDNIQAASIYDVTGVVKYKVQTLSTSQKKQARINIGAAALTDVETMIQEQLGVIENGTY